ncbi:disks large-associated protein 5-like isoform X2 [Ornithodoros turicata]|uniref:disks large-associated protein 5-like isoform X2 n=1 Tax=Ornithodoros turicata TaxID=34597 RepID=UPI0031390FBD
MTCITPLFWRQSIKRPYLTSFFTGEAGACSRHCEQYLYHLLCVFEVDRYVDSVPLHSWIILFCLSRMTQYFRELLSTETERLSGLCQHWEAISKCSTELNDEVQGHIRAAVGQAGLLINKKFKQFDGLIYNCENDIGEKKTTCADLQGFWDMIYFQVEDVNRKFHHLSKLQSEGWAAEENTQVTKKALKQRPKAVKKSAPMCEAQKVRRPTVRQWLAEAKAHKATREQGEGDEENMST